MSIEHLIQDINIWQDQTFPKATVQSVLDHLKEEVNEFDTSRLPEEVADMFMLICGLANKSGFDLIEEVQQKLEINKNRDWTPVSKGYWKHVEVSE